MKKIRTDSLNKNSSIWANYIYNTLYNILIIVVPLITTPYISRVLSVESIGIGSYTHSQTLYFTAFVALGTKSYAIKRIARAKSDEEISVVFWNVFLLRFLVGIVAMAVYFYCVVFKTKFFVPSLIQGVYILSVIFDIAWFYQGLENFKTIVFRNALIKLISVLLVFAFIKSDEQLNLYIFFVYGLSFVGNLLLWTQLPRYLVKIPFRSIRPFTDILEILTLFIPTLALQVYAAIDKTMIGAFSQEMIESGMYEQASKIIALLLTILTSLGIVALPRISALYHQNEYQEIRNKMRKSFAFSQMLAYPMIFGVISLSDVIIPWFLGEAYRPCIPILNILTLLFLIDGMSNLTGFQYLVATDRQRVYAVSIVVGTGINILLNWRLIPYFGAMGASIASVISEAFVLGIQIFYIVRCKKELRLSDLFGGTPKYLFCSIVMLAVVRALRIVIPNHYLGIAVIIVVAIALYFAILYALGDKVVKEVLLYRLLPMLKKIISSRKSGGCR